MAARTRSISSSTTGIGRRIGVGIHAVRAGQDALEDGATVGQPLARLVGHALECQPAALLDGLQGGLDIVLRGPEQHLGVVLAGLQRLAQRREDILTRSRFQLLGMEHVGLFQAGDDLQAVGDLVGEHFPGLGEMRQDAPETGQVDGQQPQFPLLRFTEHGQALPRASASTSLAAIFQSLPSPRRSDAIRPRISSSAFWRKASLCTSSGIQAMCATPLISTRVPPADADVDVLAGGADAGAHLAGAARQEADVVGRFGRLVGGEHVGIGHRLDQRHAQAVGGVDPRVADIGHFAAGILLDAQLDDPDLLPLERDLALDAQDAGALESGGDAAVEVLLARDVELADDIGLEQQRHLHGDLHRLAVEQEGRRVVDLIGAGGLVLDAVDHDLARLELHQRRAVVLAELGKGRPHVADDLGVVIGVVVVAAGRAMAEKLFFGLQLLMHFQAALESQPGVGRRRRFPARGVADLFSLSS